MNLREALIIQSPSLELQRAASIEIARLDGVVSSLQANHYQVQARLARILELTRRAHELQNALTDSDEIPNCYDHADLMEIIDAISVIITEDK